MINNIFRKAVFISAFMHLAAFSIFNFSFGARLPFVNYTPVYFWGALLGQNELKGRISSDMPGQRRLSVSVMPDKKMTPDIKDKYPSPLLITYYFKPLLGPCANSEKIRFTPTAIAALLPPGREHQEIMFYPALPYHFLLYFKDRQVAHIELMFKITPAGSRSSVVLKRKISSGNLEADLLSMRYISHYLFIQQGAFASDTWQTVKIDLSPKNSSQ